MEMNLLDAYMQYIERPKEAGAETAMIKG